jgi:ribosomal protein S24E
MKMDIKIIEDKKQALFSRKILTAEIDFGARKTPSREEIRKEFSKQIKADSKLLSIRNIATSYGSRKAIVQAYLYPSEAELIKQEPKHIMKRHAGKEKAGEEKKEEPAAKGE